jgi:hypothetical protein
MTHQPTQQLSNEEIAAVKFAAHRQLARWSNKPELTPHQHDQRAALVRAVRIFQEDAFTGGCELRTPEDEQHADASRLAQGRTRTL